jgi:hypothetical protein
VTSAALESGQDFGARDCDDSFRSCGHGEAPLSAQQQRT